MSGSVPSDDVAATVVQRVINAALETLLDVREPILVVSLVFDDQAGLAPILAYVVDSQRTHWLSAGLPRRDLNLRLWYPQGNPRLSRSS